MFDVKTGVRQVDVWSSILLGLVINYVLINFSVQRGIDIGRCVADLDFAYDVYILGVSDSEFQANLYKIESSAEVVGLMINVGKAKNMGVKCEKPGASVPIAQKNLEDLTENHKGRFGTLIEAENQCRLLIGRELLVGKKKNASWFETLTGEKLRLKSSAEVELVTVSSEERSVVVDLVFTASNRSSAVSDDKSCVCSGCKRRFDTARGCKVHEARFCKSRNSKRVEDSASKFVGLEKSLTCQKCTRKFATVKGRLIHESRYCGREKAGRSRIFSCNVHDRDGVEFENVEAFKILGSFVSLQHGDLIEISVKLVEGRQRFASFQKLWKSKQLSIPLKCKLYRALVLSVVLYSSETGTMNKSTQRKLESFHTSCLRRILCFSYLEMVTNEEVLARSRMSTLSAMIMIKRLKWFGHVLRMNDDRLAPRAFIWEPTEKYRYNKRAPEGQRKTWLDQLEEDCSRNNRSYITLRQKARRESKFRFNSFVEQHFLD